MANSETSLLGRLQYAKQPEFGDALEEFLGTTNAPDKAVEIVQKRLDDGICIRGDHLAQLIVRSCSSTLYSKVRDQLLKDHWAMLQLYKGRNPDPEIESNLCHTLHTIAPNDDEPLRRYIVEAMGDVGSEAALPALEAILFELEPSAKLQKMFSSVLETSLLGRLKVKSRSEFVKIAAQAIEAIGG